jgi:hypothetical protein
MPDESVQHVLWENMGEVPKARLDEDLDGQSHWRVRSLLLALQDGSYIYHAREGTHQNTESE